MQGLFRARALLLKRSRMRETVLQALSYPLFLLALLILLLLVLSFVLVPQFAQVLPPANWQGEAHLLFVLSDFVASWRGLLAGVVLCLGLVLCVLSLPRLCGRCRVLLDHLPPWSIYRRLVGAAWLLQLRDLMLQGIQPREIFARNLKSRISPYLKEKIAAIDARMAEGCNLGVAMYRACPGFPEKSIVEDLVLYASLPGFEGELEAIAEESLTETLESVKGSMRLVSTTLLFGIAAGIVFLLRALSVLQVSFADV